jgi:hypothetical protein
MLETELNIYAAKVAGLKADEGKFVLIQGENIVGIYQTHEQALKHGRAQFGATPFLVKQIEYIRARPSSCMCQDCQTQE